MLNQRKLSLLYRNPVNNAGDIIQDQLERVEVQFDVHCHHNDPGNALAIYQEYQEWIDCDDDDTNELLLIQRIPS